MLLLLMLMVDYLLVFDNGSGAGFLNFTLNEEIVGVALFIVQTGFQFRNSLL